MDSDESIENTTLGWTGPGDALGGLSASDSGDYVSLDDAYAEPEFARVAAAKGLKPTFSAENPTAISTTNFLISIPKVEHKTFEKSEYSTNNAEDIIDMSAKLKNPFDSKVFCQTIENRLVVKTVSVPIGENVKAKHNVFNLTTNGKFCMTNLRIRGNVLPYITCARLVCSMNIIDTVYDYNSWQKFRALFADNQEDAGRMPFSCLMGGNCVPMFGKTGEPLQWQLIIQFSNASLPSDSCIEYDLVECPVEEICTAPVLRTELLAADKVLGNWCCGFMVKNTQFSSFDILEGETYKTILHLEQHYELGEWHWYPFGQTMLCNMPSDKLLRLDYNMILDHVQAAGTGVVGFYPVNLVWSDSSVGILGH